jgi:hypothetical protein
MECEAELKATARGTPSSATGELHQSTLQNARGLSMRVPDSETHRRRAWSLSRELLALVVVLSSPKIARGQNGGESATSSRVIAGVVRDTTNRPIEGVQVQADRRQFVLTDSGGRFRVTGIGGASVFLGFRRLGYEPASRTIALHESTPGLIEVVLTPNSQLLRTIVVEGQAYDRDLWANGFYHRRKMASGSFFDPDFLMHFGGSGLGSVLHEVPRVQVERMHNQEYAFSTVGGNRCRRSSLGWDQVRASRVDPCREFRRGAPCTPRPQRTPTPRAAPSSSGPGRRERGESVAPLGEVPPFAAFRPRLRNDNAGFYSTRTTTI